jgi:hypothetical protein
MLHPILDGDQIAACFEYVIPHPCLNALSRLARVDRDVRV